MFGSRKLVTVIILCAVHGSLCKPYSPSSPEGRGVGSTLWGWITYPFSWWSSDDSEIPFESGQGFGLNRFDSYNSVEIGRYNVTLWCNEQTCTTVKCDRFGCVNITCSMYDTDITGECRSFNTNLRPEEPTTPKSPETSIQAQENETTSKPAHPVTTSTVAVAPTENDNGRNTEERPLELEAVLSSTVTEHVDKQIAAA